MVGRLRVRGFFQGRDQILDRLGPFARHHQHRVAARDHHHVLGAHDGGQHLVRMDEAVVRIERHRGPVHRVAGGIALGDIEDGRPVADVGPAEAALDHGGAVGALH